MFSGHGFPRRPSAPVGTREDRRPCPPCRRAVPPSVTVQRRNGAADRSQAAAGAVVCPSRLRLASRLSRAAPVAGGRWRCWCRGAALLRGYAQASVQDWLHGREGQRQPVPVSPHPPATTTQTHAPVSTRVRLLVGPCPSIPPRLTCCLPWRRTRTKSPVLLPGDFGMGDRGPRIVARPTATGRPCVCARVVWRWTALVLRATVHRAGRLGLFGAAELHAWSRTNGRAASY